LPGIALHGAHIAAVLGLPFNLNPVSAWKYGTAYQRGKSDAERDIAAGIFATETYGMGAGGRHVELLRERFGIDTRIVAGCSVDIEILGHAAGYNKISEPEIDRRFGRAAIFATRAEADKLAADEYEQQKQSERALAVRISSFKPGDHAVLTSLSLYPADAVSTGQLTEEKLARIVHAIEAHVAAHVPADVPPFELSVHGRIEPDAPPSVSTGGNGVLPQPAYMEIYERVKALPDIRSDGAGVSYNLSFAKGSGPAMPLAASR
jgi:hypothetical protein